MVRGPAVILRRERSEPRRTAGHLTKANAGVLPRGRGNSGAAPDQSDQLRSNSYIPRIMTPADTETPTAARPVAKGDHVYLIDGSGYIFRAYHALPPLTRPSDGL